MLVRLLECLKKLLKGLKGQNILSCCRVWNIKTLSRLNIEKFRELVEDEDWLIIRDDIFDVYKSVSPSSPFQFI